MICRIGLVISRPHYSKELYIYTSNSIYSHRTGTEGTQLFKCTSGDYISMKHLSNGKGDCLNNEDETAALCFAGGQLKRGTFCQTSCFPPTCSCSDLYLHTMQHGCIPFRKACDKNCLLHLNGMVNIMVFVREMLLENMNSSKSEVIVPKHDKHSVLFTDCSEKELSSNRFMNQKKMDFVVL